MIMLIALLMVTLVFFGFVIGLVELITDSAKEAAAKEVKKYCQGKNIK